MLVAVALAAAAYGGWNSLSWFGNDARSQTAVEKGRVIAREIELRDHGFGDNAADFKLALGKGGGQTGTRQVQTDEPELPPRYTYRWLRDETCGALSCFVIERMPLYDNPGHTRQILWADSEHYRPLTIKYFGRRGELLKTLQYGDYRKYFDRYWRAHELFIENHRTGKTTKLAFSGYRLRVGSQKAIEEAALR